MSIDRTTVRRKKAQASASRSKVLVLTVVQGENLGKEFTLKKRKIVIGREDSADLVVPDSSISRRHAEFVIKRGGKPGSKPQIMVRDLGSTNGTLLNYKRITRALVKEGDKISLGRTIFKLEFKDVCDQRFLDRLRTLSSMDGLTGLRNKTSILRLAKEEFSRSARYRRPLSLMMIDIDFFKSVNDTFGHTMGDVVLKRVGYTLASSIREQDRIGRFGGEEFIVLLPETPQAEALIVAERVREKVSVLQFDHKRAKFQITISIGVSTKPQSAAQRFETLLEAADQCLYLAKRNGRNRIEAADLQSNTAPLAAVQSL